jgi:hypothetical protein
MSSNSSTSTRSSSKNSRHQTITSLKRSISPTITLAVERSSEKRRQQREQRKAKALIKIPDDIEQENDDDDDIISIKPKKSKQRQASNSSVEYVQIINNDQQSISSLNNIENYDEDIIVCHSSPKKTSVNGIHKINNHQVITEGKTKTTDEYLFIFRHQIMMKIFEFDVKYAEIYLKDEVDFQNMY